MEMHEIQPYIGQLVPLEGGGYLEYPANNSYPSGKEIPGPQIFVVLPQSLQHIQNDVTVWSRVSNKNDILHCADGIDWLNNLHKYTTWIEYTLALLIQSGGKGFAIITCSNPPAVTEFYSMLAKAKSDNEKPNGTNTQVESIKQHGEPAIMLN